MRLFAIPGAAFRGAQPRDNFLEFFKGISMLARGHIERGKETQFY